ATPVFESDGKPFGFLIVTLDMTSAFADIESAAGVNGQVFIVNQDGDYILNPDHAREFGFDFDRRYRLQDDYPVLAPALASADPFRGVHMVAGRAVASAVIPVRLGNAGPLVRIVHTIPLATALAGAAAV